MAEEKNSGLFWGLILLVGGSAVWAINKFMSQNNNTDNSIGNDIAKTDVTKDLGTWTPPAFDINTFIEGVWACETYKNGANHTKDIVAIRNNQIINVSGGSNDYGIKRNITNIKYNDSNNTLTFNLQGIGSVNLIVDHTKKAEMSGMQGVYNAIYTKVGELNSLDKSINLDTIKPKAATPEKGGGSTTNISTSTSVKPMSTLETMFKNIDDRIKSQQQMVQTINRTSFTPA